jgi:hypothetical protein
MRKLILTLTAIGITGLLWAQPQGALQVQVYDIITGSSLNQASVQLGELRREYQPHRQHRRRKLCLVQQPTNYADLYHHRLVH